MRIVGKLTVPILAVAGLIVPLTAQAEDFRFQVQAVYDQIDFDDADEDADSLLGIGTFFFKPVPTDGVPVGEAAYIHRSSYLDVAAQGVEFGDADADALAANLGYHFTDTVLSILFARIGVVQTDVSGEDDTTWNGTLGIVPIPRLFFGTDFTEDDWDPNVTARYAGELANKHWYAASVTVADPDEGDTDVGVEFDYYFPAFKLGGGFSSGTDLWNVRAEVGLPQGFALQGRVFGDDGGDGFGLQLTWRDL
jgi:hypothetical protein